MKFFSGRTGRWLAIAVAWMALASEAAVAVNCSTSTDGSCTGEHSALFAIAHDHVDTSLVLTRVTIDAWSPGTRWGDGTNGFFYWVTAGGQSWDFTPFNGLAVGADGQPALPAFSFIVPIPEGATDLEVTACASNFEGTGNVPACSDTLWTETFTTPPMPVVGAAVLTPTLGALTFSISMPLVQANGAYGAPVELIINLPAATQAQLDWLFDHLVWFDRAGNAQRNSIYPSGDASDPQGVGVLSLDQATFEDPASGDRLTKYGDGIGRTAPLAPNRLLYVYTQQSVGSQPVLGLGLIFDENATCLGKVVGKACGGTGTPLGTLMPSLTLTVENGRATSQDVLDFDGSGGELVSAAGQIEIRRAKVQLTSASGACEGLANPLAINETGTSSAYNPPNYVLDDTAFLGGAATTGSFPRGLYYVVPNGFGNCSATLRPFCDRASDYVGYVPHYLDQSGSSTGSLNGGGTTATRVGGFALADQYYLTGLLTVAENSLNFFDDCGYWHQYSEALDSAQRLTVPPPTLPSNRDTYMYTIENNTGQPLVVAKECCASLYQMNPSTHAQEPPQMLDDGFGLYVGAGASVEYQTIFADEVWVVYDAGTGQRQFKLYATTGTPTDSRVYACTPSAADSTVAFTQASDTQFSVALGGSGLACTKTPACPFGMAQKSSGGTRQCTVTRSSFLLGMSEWAEAREESMASAVQVRAWGGKGSKNNADGGNGGFALTVRKPSDLAKGPGLYAYIGQHGSGTILGNSALSKLSADGMDFEQQSPAAGGMVLIAGGGGDGGNLQDCAGTANAGETGLAGHVAITNRVTPNGIALARPSSGGISGPGGESGNESGWNDGGALVATTDWLAGKGRAGRESKAFGCTKTVGGPGGGGFTGGSGGIGTEGGTGGGSWAAANTVHDPSAPSSAPSSPGGATGAVELVYLKGPCALDSSGVRPIVRCVYAESLVGGSALDMSALLTGLFGNTIDLDDLPIYIEAWGGAGGNGGDAAPQTTNHAVGPGGGAGAAGYARSSQYWSDLRELGTAWSLYVGAAGPDGNECSVSGTACSGHGGNGGASTLVTTSPLNTDEDSDPAVAGVLVLAAGGGGGGGGYSTGDDAFPGRSGGNAGSAIATTTADGLAGGGRSIGGGRGGSSGIAGCGNNDQNCGTDGLGGLGGPAGGESATPWHGLSSGWAAGAGGTGSPNRSGGGGAGFGGGGGGNQSCAPIVSDPAGCGGGAGGSWARLAGIDDTEAPIVGAGNVDSLGEGTGAGVVVLSFDICALDPEDEVYCTPESEGFLTTHARVGFERWWQRVAYLDIWGSETFDVRDVDLARIRIGPTMAAPGKLDHIRFRDRNRDGYPDLRIDIRRLGGEPRSIRNWSSRFEQTEEDPLFIRDEEAALCVHGAFYDGTPFVGCARPQTRWEQRAARSIE